MRRVKVMERQLDPENTLEMEETSKSKARNYQDFGVYIAGATRTPIGSFGGALASVPATKLGSIAIEAALTKSKVPAKDVEEVILGNVCSAGLGQAPAKQASLGAGIPDSVPCTTVNKVCSSSLKALMMGAQNILLGHSDVVVVGGFENMSQVPYYDMQRRWGSKYGNSELKDGLMLDGLWDPVNDFAMGEAGELCSDKYSISREEQDKFADRSYNYSLNARKSGDVDWEITPVTVTVKGKSMEIKEDEEPKRYISYEKLASLRTSFRKNGTVTAGNSSPLSDGASAVVLVSGKYARMNNDVPILAQVFGFADAEQKPEEFPTSPSLAIPLALKRSGLTVEDMDFFEINEAFAVVALANQKILGIPDEKYNVLGGAVSLGHPLGASGTRILTTLLNALRTRGGEYGCAGICNGGGGASSVVIRSLQ